jgi:hypothetical protein
VSLPVFESPTAANDAHRRGTSRRPHDEAQTGLGWPSSCALPSGSIGFRKLPCRRPARAAGGWPRRSATNTALGLVDRTRFCISASMTSSSWSTTTSKAVSELRSWPWRRRVRSPSRKASALILAVAAACSQSGSDPAGLFLPTYRPMNSAPTALLEGTLVEDDGCLWIETDNGRHLMLWPEASSVLDGDGQRAVRNDGDVAIVGTRVSAGGGEYGTEHYEFVVELIGRDVPEPCRTSGKYWLCREVRTVERSSLVPRNRGIHAHWASGWGHLARLAGDREVIWDWARL